MATLVEPRTTSGACTDIHGGDGKRIRAGCSGNVRMPSICAVAVPMSRTGVKEPDRSSVLNPKTIAVKPEPNTELSR
jgi:hypothetical protein